MIASQARLFELLSSKSDIDHPLCEDCAQVLLNSLTRKLEETKRERDGYVAFEREIRKEQEREKAAGKSETELDEEIARLELKEAEAVKELKEAEAERIRLEQELEALYAEERKLEEEEEE
jgi:beclin 1